MAGHPCDVPWPGIHVACHGKASMWCAIGFHRKAMVVRGSAAVERKLGICVERRDAVEQERAMIQIQAVHR